MDASVLAAVIAGVTSVVVASVTAYVTTKQGGLSRIMQRQQLAAQKTLEDQRVAAQKAISDVRIVAERELEHYKQQLQDAAQEAERLRAVSVERDRFWTPLRDAADDLRHRIRNIRELEFRFYFGQEQPRRTVALQSTFYRFAKYWGAAENVYRADPRLCLQEEEPRAWDIMTQIGRTFALDSYGQEFMVWREEQRAIGELVLDWTTGEVPRPLMGFASFVRRYEQDFEAWFAPRRPGARDRSPAAGTVAWLVAGSWARRGAGRERRRCGRRYGRG